MTGMRKSIINSFLFMGVQKVSDKVKKDFKKKIKKPTTKPRYISDYLQITRFIIKDKNKFGHQQDCIICLFILSFDLIGNNFFHF